MISVSVTCPQCEGDGLIDLWENDVIIGTESCPLCSGTGRYSTGILNSVESFFTHQVSDATAPAEYNALTDGQKEVYSLIISMGIVSLADGTNTKAALWSLFGDGTTTRANLVTLIAG